VKREENASGLCRRRQASLKGTLGDGTH